MVQAQLKRYVRERNVTSKIKDVYKLVLEAFDHVTAENWSACIEHVKKQELAFEESDAKLEAFENDNEDDGEWQDVIETAPDDVDPATENEGTA